MSNYQHILYATDLSESSHATADKAALLAEKFGAKLSILHAIEPIPAYGAPDVGHFDSPFIDAAKKELACIGARLKVPEEDQITAFGSIKHEVIRIAENRNVDLIVIGSHGTHGLTTLLGSTANAIINAANCDVITIRSKT